jgi:phosphoglycolate phosphatase-like HAD superfamily hydrolase
VTSPSTRSGAVSASLLAVAIADPAAARAPDPLASWNETAPKKAIVAFVERVTRPGSADFVVPAERIATFDNDGTLWAEQPIYFQFQFALDRVKTLALQHPEWKTTEPFSHLLSGDMKALLAGGETSIVPILAAAHSGMTTEQFEGTVREWLRTARHPKTGRLYTAMVFQPMLELLAYLRANGFKTFIVSGGGVEFIRVFAEEVYGIPPEQVVGSQGKLHYEVRDGEPVLVKLPEVQFVDDHEGKPAGIQTFIGRRPIAAFGNSDGDLQMLEWTTGGRGARFGLIVHHDDAAREWAYDRQSHVGKLDAALDAAGGRGWALVSMKNDWNAVFPP